MKIVLDTNVLVSGLLNPFGPSAEIVRMTSSGVLKVCHDARILSEYREVLLRPKFLFYPPHVEALLSQIKHGGEPISSIPLAHRLPDPDDEPFLEAAIASKARCLITGNLKHYPGSRIEAPPVLSPRQFLDKYRHFH